MNCNEILNYINNFYDGLLTSQQKLEMELHIAKCTDCKHQFAIYSNLFESIKLLPANTVVPKALPAQIFDEIIKEIAIKEDAKSAGVLDKLKSKIKKK